LGRFSTSAAISINDHKLVFLVGQLVGIDDDSGIVYPLLSVIYYYIKSEAIMPSNEILDFGELGTGAKGIVNAVRQNHALEHATVAVLQMRKEGRVRLAGRAGIDGFYLYGDISTEALEDAAGEALRRLQAGEKGLAVSPFCGTNLVVSGLAAGVASMFAGRGHKGLGKFIRIAEASIFATVAAQPLGRVVQKHLTTKSDLDSIRITQVIKIGEGKATRHKVEISRG